MGIAPDYYKREWVRLGESIQLSLNLVKVKCPRCGAIYLTNKEEGKCPLCQFGVVKKKKFMLVRLTEDLADSRKGELVQLVDWLAEKLVREGRASLVNQSCDSLGNESKQRIE